MAVRLLIVLVVELVVPGGLSLTVSLVPVKMILVKKLNATCIVIQILVKVMVMTVNGNVVPNKSVRGPTPLLPLLPVVVVVR